MPYLNLYALDYVILLASSSRSNLKSRRSTRQAVRRSPSEGRCWRSGGYLRSTCAYGMQCFCSRGAQPAEHVHVMLLVREARTALENHPPRGHTTTSIAFHSVLLHVCLRRLLLSSGCNWRSRLSKLTIPPRYCLCSCPKTLRCTLFMVTYRPLRENAR